MSLLLLPPPILLNCLNILHLFSGCAISTMPHRIAIPYSLPFNSHLDLILGVPIYLMVIIHLYINISLEIYRDLLVIKSSFSIISLRTGLYQYFFSSYMLLTIYLCPLYWKVSVPRYKILGSHFLSLTILKILLNSLVT